MLVAIFLGAATWNRDEVLVPRPDGGTMVVFADGDCHSRMQRAAMVQHAPGTIIRAHDFENHPEGTVPHTTAPMDHLIVLLGLVLRPLDLAGAWISPLLGLLALVFLWSWSRALDLNPRWPTLLLFCISPALTHAFAFGRPDHQSLLVALTTVALAAGFAFVKTGKPGWAWCAGIAWGLALWVSWFEPLILLAAQEIARGLALRRGGRPMAWRRALVLAAGIALGAWALEGFRIPWPGNEVRAFFPRWASMLGELQPAGPRAMFAWTGWLLAPAPLLLGWDYFKKRDPLALMCLVLLAVVTALTGWQARWSPWLAAVFCLSLPWLLRLPGKKWVAWTAFVASLWPVAAAWEMRLFPSPREQMLRSEKIAEAAYVDQIAAFLRQQPRGGVLAPWWISPALARSSGQPAVAGTSHQSLPGSTDAARFFLSDDDHVAAALLGLRKVKYVVTDTPERVVPTSATLLGVPPPQNPLITRLADARNVPVFLEPVFANRFFRVYKVRDE
ncbi:MAG: hypothetical protein FGM15_09150 [Chthoniobacterales bacterium]|nr:hypothetical protein [Chthoniobacterales bacterium]